MYLVGILIGWSSRYSVPDWLVFIFCSDQFWRAVHNNNNIRPIVHYTGSGPEHGKFSLCQKNYLSHKPGIMTPVGQAII